MDRDEMQAMMREHHQSDALRSRGCLEGRYDDDAEAYDAIHVQILHMADMLSDGIVAEFPGQFGR